MIDKNNRDVLRTGQAVVAVMQRCTDDLSLVVGKDQGRSGLIEMARPDAVEQDVFNLDLPRLGLGVSLDCLDELLNRATRKIA